MRRARLAVVSAITLGASACGPAPAPQPPQPIATAVTPVATASVTATAAAGPDLSPVSEPGDIVGVMRWRSPIASISNLASCAGIAPMLVEINARMGMDVVMRQVLRGFDTRKLGAVVALDAPLDVLVMLDSNPRPRPPLIAVAVGLTSLEGAKVAVSPEGGSPPELAPGVYRVPGGRDAACAIAASAGATPARLVCAEKEKALTVVAPYLARTAPSLDFGGQDIHVEARIDVLRKRYGEQIQGFLRSMPGALATEYGDDAKLDKLLLGAGTDIQQDVSKLFDDMRRVTADVQTSKSGACLKATAEVELSGKTSWLAQALTDSLDKQGPAPQIFWQLPKDSQLATYSHGSDPVRYAGVIKTARELVEATLTSGNFGAPADRKKIAELIDMPYGKDTSVVMAHGQGPVTTLPEATAKGAQEKIIQASFERLVGWTMIGVSEEPTAMRKQLHAWVDAYKLAGVQSWLKKELGSDAKYMPVVKSGSVPSTLGARSEAFEITMSNLEVPEAPGATDAKGAKGAKPKTMSLTLHVVLSNDGNFTWLGIGASKEDLVKHLALALQGGPEKEKIGARSGLETLKNGKQRAGGFMTLGLFGQKIAGAIQGFTALDPTGYFNQDEIALGQSLMSLPNAGGSPVVMTAGGTPGPSPKVSVSMELPQGSVEDMKALILSNYKVLGRWGLLP